MTKDLKKCTDRFIKPCRTCKNNLQDSNECYNKRSCFHCPKYQKIRPKDLTSGGFSYMLVEKEAI